MFINVTSALHSFTHTPVSESLYSGASSLASYISNTLTPNGALTKAFTYVPIRALGAMASQGAIFVLSAELGNTAYTAYKNNNKKKTIGFAAAALLTVAFGIFEIVKFRNVLSCFNSFECDRTFKATLSNKDTWLNPMAACAAQAGKVFSSCLG